MVQIVEYESVKYYEHSNCMVICELVIATILLSEESNAINCKEGAKYNEKMQVDAEL